MRVRVHTRGSKILFAHAFVMADHLVDDEAQELLGEVGVEFGAAREPAQPFDLRRLARRVGGGQPGGRLVPPDRLRDLEPLGEQEDERGVDVVDALAVTRQRVVAHRPFPA